MEGSAGQQKKAFDMLKRREHTVSLYNIPVVTSLNHDVTIEHTVSLYKVPNPPESEQ